MKKNDENLDFLAEALTLGLDSAFDIINESLNNILNDKGTLADFMIADSLELIMFSLRILGSTLHKCNLDETSKTEEAVEVQSNIAQNKSDILK